MTFVKRVKISNGVNFNPSAKFRASIPEEILNIAEKLRKADFQVYLVGGCVRDILRKSVYGELVEPKDWDIATNAKPDEIQNIFPDSVYENKFGTVAVKTGSENERLKIVEITTFRIEGKYTDKRHPDKIKFAKTIEEDLARRDFTINALALRLAEGKADEIIDPFNGQDDIKNKIIRTVGNPEERFNEDALRLMRAVRFAVNLDFNVEEKTAKAIKKESGLLEMIAKERIREEFLKILMAEKAASGIQVLEDLGLLRYVAPELRDGIGVGQNKHHIYTVWEHNLKALEYAAKKNYSLEIRLSALFHDIGKPATKAGEGLNSTFYNHEIVSAKITARILDRLRFPKDLAEKIIHLVRYHLFYYNVGEVTEAGVRRFLSRVGSKNVDDLIKLREADRIGSGVPKAVPYKLRHLLFMIEKVKQDPIDTRMLKLDGNDVMRLGGLPPSPKVGQILAVLLEEIIDDPKKNSEDYLAQRIQELNLLAEGELKQSAEKAKARKQEFESGLMEEIKKKYYVK